MRFDIDFDAAGWFIVAFIASAFGLLLVLPLGLLINGGPLGDTAYFVMQAGLTVAIYGTAAALLVRARPWRSLLELVIALYLLSLLAALGLALVRFVASPGAWGQLAKDLVPALTFGLVQIDSLAPLRFGPPDPSPYVGVAVGFGLMRWWLVRTGKAVGEAARPSIHPWPVKRTPGGERGGSA